MAAKDVRAGVLRTRTAHNFETMVLQENSLAIKATMEISRFILVEELEAVMVSNNQELGGGEEMSELLDSLDDYRSSDF